MSEKKGWIWVGLRWPTIGIQNENGSAILQATGGEFRLFTRLKGSPPAKGVIRFGRLDCAVNAVKESCWGPIPQELVVRLSTGTNH